MHSPLRAERICLDGVLTLIDHLSYDEQQQLAAALSKLQELAGAADGNFEQVELEPGVSAREVFAYLKGRNGKK